VLPASTAGLLQRRSSPGQWQRQGLGCENRLGTSLRWVGSVFSSSTFLCTFLLFLLELNWQQKTVVVQGLECLCRCCKKESISAALHTHVLAAVKLWHYGALCVACNCKSLVVVWTWRLLAATAL
jgi:hypothetical protein